MTTWHKGPPLSVGWWPAGWNRDPRILRWWDGTRWSWPASDRMSAAHAEEHARIPSSVSTEIEWTDRPADWPERSKT
jgi:hypothetical protein